MDHFNGHRDQTLEIKISFSIWHVLFVWPNQSCLMHKMKKLYINYRPLATCHIQLDPSVASGHLCLSLVFHIWLNILHHTNYERFASFHMVMLVMFRKLNISCDEFKFASVRK